MRLEDLAPMGIAFVVVAIVLGVGADIMSEVESDLAASAPGPANSTAADAAANGTAALGELASWLPTLALVLAAAVIIGVVVSYFAFKR